MIAHNINPVFFSIGPIDVRYYGLVYFFGFLFVYFFLRWMIKQNKISNMDQDSLDTFMVYLALGIIVGARLFEFIFYVPQTLISDPIEFFRVWNGGMSYHGGLAGAMFAGWLYTKKHKVDYYELADMLVIPAIFFLAVGRIANYINGELWGTIANSGICVDYSQSQYIGNPPSGCRHPYQLYASLKNFIVFGFTYGLTRYKLQKGLVFWWGILLYNGLRIIVDLVREEAVFILGMKMGQTLSLFFVILSIVYIVKINRGKKKKHK